jgi:hypothetical protein
MNPLIGARQMSFNTIEEVTNSRSKVISLTRKYNQLDSLAKEAINHSFMLNMRAIGKSQISVADAVKEFYGRDTQVK